MADAGPYLLRYVAGECAQVWAQLSALEEGVREPAVFEDAWAVALETMRRVRRNLVTIHRRLLDSGYSFAVPEHALVEPAATAASLLAQIERG